MAKTVILQLPDGVYEKLIKYLEKEKSNLNDWVVNLIQESMQKKGFYASEGKYYQSQLSFNEGERLVSESLTTND